jgi:hypothetical protein
MTHSISKHEKRDSPIFLYHICRPHALHQAYPEMRRRWTCHCAPWIPELYPVELYILGACPRRRPVASHGNAHLGAWLRRWYVAAHIMVTHDDRKLFVLRGQHSMGKGAHLGAHPAAACTEKSRWHSSARRRRRHAAVPRVGGSHPRCARAVYTSPAGTVACVRKKSELPIENA